MDKENLKQCVPKLSKCLSQFGLWNKGTKTGALLNNRNFYLIVLEAGRLRSQGGSMVLGSGEDLPGCRLPTSCTLMWQSTKRGSKLSHDCYKGSTLMTSNFNYSTSYCRYQSSLLIGFQCMKFWGNTASLVHNTKEIKLLLC